MKLQYNRNRYYSQSTGRWLSRDPLGINPALSGGDLGPVTQYRDGMNLYEYVKSNPTGKLDALGLAVGEALACCTVTDTSKWAKLGFRPKCFQKTILSDLAPRLACKCQYEYNYKTGKFGGTKKTVDKYKAGKCCTSS